ncbi:MAG TPA: DUF4097 family beta strand repeat-containing protein [Pseudoxanthomonas sp.]|nr:DUF4097 family beta strand repeat-containing protein [Pseudoxanthomonas sp.]
MRNFSSSASLFLVPLLALSAAAGAATPIDQTRALDARGRVDIENLKGRIQVRAWERNEVKISGTLGDGVEKLVVEGDAEHLVVKVQYPRNNGWGGNKSGPTDLQLTVPVRAELEIDSVSADVDVSGVASSKLSIDSVSGSVLVAAAPGEVDVESVSGDLRLTVNSGDVQAQTVSGGIILRGRMNGQIKTETVSGDIDVAVNGERVSEFSSSTVSGNAQVRTALAAKGEIGMESVSGDLLLVLPKNLSAQVSGESFSGDLKAPGAKIQRPEHGPGSSFNTRYGTGEGEIRIETFSGNAELRLE